MAFKTSIIFVFVFSASLKVNKRIPDMVMLVQILLPTLIKIIYFYKVQSVIAFCKGEPDAPGVFIVYICTCKSVCFF